MKGANLWQWGRCPQRSRGSGLESPPYDRRQRRQILQPGVSQRTPGSGYIFPPNANGVPEAAGLEDRPTCNTARANRRTLGATEPHSAGLTPSGIRRGNKGTAKARLATEPR